MKNIIKAAFVAAFAAVAGYGVYMNQKVDTISDVMLANVEALADNEESDVCKWNRKLDSHGCPYYICEAGGDGYICSCGTVDWS